MSAGAGDATGAGPHLVGRDRELAELRTVLAELATGPAVVVLEGEPGIGKTALWTAGRAAAAAAGVRVLECRPIQAEAQLAYAALGDLLVDVPETALAGLPPPQRRALDVALLRAEPDEQAPFPRAVALALLGVLRALAAERPVLVAVDDAQWLDPPSETALAFVTRRLHDERVGVLVTRRLDAGPGYPLDLGRDGVLGDGRLRRLRLGALDLADVDRLLHERLGARVPARALGRLHAAAGGNAYFALEMGRALLDADTHAADAAADSAAAMPIPPSLQELVGARLAALDPAARHVAEVAAALSRPTVTALVHAAGAGEGAGVGSTEVAAAAVESAVTAGVLERHGERVGFRHPLLASVVLLRMAPDDKRALHARLAAASDDPEERARHLALSTHRPSAEAAAVVDEGARRARARGAPDAAALLWSEARRLTPPDDPGAARRRGVEAAERHFDAGDVGRARALLEEIARSAPAGRERAVALTRLGWVVAHTSGFAGGAATFQRALDEHADDVALRIEIEVGLSWCLHSTVGVPEAEGHARMAVALAESLGDPTLLGEALSHLAFIEALAGRGVPLGIIERAVDLFHAPAWSQILGRPDWIHALLLQWAGDLDAARRRFAALHQEALDRGDEHSLPFILFQLARVELLTGDWAAAGVHARECDETTRESASERPYALTIRALVDAHLGLVDAARDHIATGRRLADELGAQPAGLELLAAEGFLELSLGHAAAAAAALDALAAAASRTGFGEPAVFRHHGDAVEAAVARGDLAGAAARLDALEATAAALDHRWARTAAARGRGLLLAATGDLPGAQSVLERALGPDATPEPFERARTLLALGTVQRRDRQKRTARESLEAAREVFADLGAALWVARADEELARVGGRAPQDGLTPTEARVAGLIAAGRTYQEAAAELFISPKTVQWNLSKVYRKLGIRSRAELPARLAAPGDDGGDGDGD